MTITAVISAKKHLSELILPFIFPMLHIAYGLGTVVGIFQMPFWLKKRDKNSKQNIENVSIEMKKISKN